jgi:hypothetical protein
MADRWHEMLKLPRVYDYQRIVFVRDYYYYYYYYSYYYYYYD